MDDYISRHAAIDALKNRWKKTRNYEGIGDDIAEECELYLKQLPSAQPEIIQCKDCKHNPKESWFGCPMSHLSEEQRPGTAWCWKGERKDDE